MNTDEHLHAQLIRAVMHSLVWAVWGIAAGRHFRKEKKGTATTPNTKAEEKNHIETASAQGLMLDAVIRLLYGKNRDRGKQYGKGSANQRQNGSGTHSGTGRHFGKPWSIGPAFFMIHFSMITIRNENLIDKFQCLPLQRHLPTEID